MRTCKHVHVNICYTYVNTHVYKHIFIYTCAHVNICTYTYLIFMCEYTCIHDAKHVCVYMYQILLIFSRTKFELNVWSPICVTHRSLSAKEPYNQYLYLCNTHINQVYLSTHTPKISFLAILSAYTVAKMHKMPHLDRSLSAKEPYN